MCEFKRGEKIKRFIQRIKCSMPFSLNHFWHKNVYVVKQLSTQSHLIKCRDCGKMFVLHHGLRIILPWEKVESIYDDLDDILNSLEKGVKINEQSNVNR